MQYLSLYIKRNSYDYTFIIIVKAHVHAVSPMQ